MKGHTSPKTAFKKGQIAWNKGTKGIMKSNNGSFKKGNIISEKTRIIMSNSKKGEKSCKWKGGMVEKICKICSSIFLVKPYRKNTAIYCSRKCATNDNLGLTPLNEKIRKSLEMKLFKKACLERDNFTCQKTGKKGGKLEVHHINNFADFPELRTSIENGITLSIESHKEFHKKYGKRNNTYNQLIEFLNNK